MGLAFDKLARWLLILALVLIGLVWLGPIAINAAFDFQATRQEVSRIVDEKTGRELHLDGEIHFQLRSLTPGLRLTEVRLQNAPWGVRPDMLRVDVFHVHLRVLPLLRGEIDIQSLELESAEVFLETDARGRGNWRFQSRNKQDSQQAAKTTQVAALDWLVEKLVIRSSTLHYTDGKTGRLRTVAVDRAALRLSPAAITGEVDLRYGRSDLRGSIRLRLAEHAYAATLRSGVLDLDDFVQRELRVRRKARARRGAVAPFHERLPLDVLEDLALSLDWRIAELRRADWRIRQLAVKANGRRGRWQLTIPAGKALGGSLRADLRLVLEPGTGTARTIALNGQASGLQLARILRDANEKPIVQADLTARLKLQTAGATVPALAKNLSGAVALETSALNFDEPVLYASLGPEAAGAVKTWANPLPRMECFVARMDLAGGLGKSRTLLFDTDEFSIVGAGQLDLPGDQIRLALALHNKRLSVFSLAGGLPLHIDGSLSQPRFQVSDADIARDVFLSALELPALPLEYIKSIYDTGVHPGKSLCPAARAGALRNLSGLQ